ncbi:trypsin-like peptidase domain-containing protein [Streptomyces sp. JV176]|uniref:trypsin-like peptidase domain-containing protein n=1 Tax=Streptomyces sp. JV176 TaxID=858630 RepID=UPI002E766DC4|nr:trypsin-like peptidase domain-containing protein [Streptomyces sp. JV176]MEE1804154.1 trypsin-like peptidase domain-containing protein [Streptomyces sp. JV176]
MTREGRTAEEALRADRAAEIIVTLPDGGRRGSGYLVAPGRLLTAAHVVAGATGIRVRFDADRPGERTVRATVAWSDTGIDVAVLAVPADGPRPLPEPVRFARVGDSDAVLRCSAIGFPRFKLRTDEDGSRYRDSEHVHAACAVLSNRREGTLDLATTAPNCTPYAALSPWEGMSGAPVFTGGRMVGIVAHHHLGDGAGRLAARRVDRWSERLAPQALRELEETLGCGSLAPAGLPDAVPPSGLDLIQEAFSAQLEDIAPADLSGRARELRDLTAFCGGPDPYQWLQAPPWAGKTALAAWFALHPPRGVVPVWFFITARFASQSDSAAYTEAVTDQLAAIAGREPVDHRSAIAREGERKLLLKEAAERVAQDGGTLLLVVDGLDEDQSLVPGGGTGPSIASLLPRRLPPNVRVLVTSRPGPGVPPDVTSGHPLRGCEVVRLSTAEAALHTQYEATYDLSRALTGDDLGRDLVGLLAAARGSLTLHDLRHLTGAHRMAVRERLGSAFGRILRMRGQAGGGADSTGYADSAGYGGSTGYGGSHLGRTYDESRGYLFAHETLLVSALDELGPDVRPYRERLHTWAARYAEQGWPQDTPSYLLQAYGRMVTALGDLDRATVLATDVRRSDCLREATGSDAVGLAEIEAVRDAVLEADAGDIGSLAALAAAGALLARRNRALPPGIPVALARLGQTRRAVGVARSVFHPWHRARALAGVARVLAERGDRQAVSVAREALRLESGSGAWPFGPDESVVTSAAVALATMGRTSEVLAWLQPVRAGRSVLCAMSEVAVAEMRWNPGRAARLLQETEGFADELVGATEIEVLGEMAKAYATVDPSRVDHLHDRIVRAAEDADVHGLAVAVGALREARPEEALRLARLAARYELSVPSFHPPEIAEAMAALADAGAVDEAEEFLESAPVQVSWAWTAIARGRAREGRADAAWAALKAGSADGMPEGATGALSEVTAALAEAGRAAELKAIVLAEPGQNVWLAAETLAALAERVVDGDPERATRLVAAAERMAAGLGRETHDRDTDESVALLAGALAAIGRLAEAEVLIGRIGTDEVRVWALAAISAEYSRTEAAGGAEALRLAQVAADRAAAVKDWTGHARAMIVAAQALGYAGADNRARAVAEAIREGSGREPGTGLIESAGAKDLAHIAVATTLQECAPTEAADLMDALCRRGLSGDSPDEGELFATLSCLLLTASQDGTALTDHIADTVRRSGDEPHCRVLLALLESRSDPERARRRLPPEIPEPWAPIGAVAVAVVARGDNEMAVDLLDRSSAVGRLGEDYASVAGYLAGAVPDRLILPVSALIPDFTHAIRQLASLVAPREATPANRARALPLLRKALTAEDWHHALPVLAVLAPEAVLRVRDVVMAHLGAPRPADPDATPVSPGAEPGTLTAGHDAPTLRE